MIQHSDSAGRYPIAIMVCTSDRGGMSNVVAAYERDGLFVRWRIRLLHSHTGGSIFRRVGIALTALISILRLLLTEHVSLVHCHSAMRGSFWRKSCFAELGRLFGKPVLLHLHGSELKVFYDGLPNWGRKVFGKQLERAAVVLVLSESWRQFVQHVAPNAKIEVLPNYVLLPTLDPKRSSVQHDPVRILFLGRIGQRKGVYDLLHAVRGINVRGIRIHLTIGGDGEIDTARRVADELGLHALIDFPGWISGERKHEYFMQTDLYVLPSHNEGLPLSVLEAMSYGLPVVTTNVGGVPELVRDGEDGFLITPGDIEALENAICRMVLNPDLRKSMGASARTRVEEKYSRERVLPQLDELYDRYISAYTRDGLPP